MEKLELEQFKANLEEFTEKLAAIKSNAAQLIEIIDAGKFADVTIIREHANQLGEYQKQYTEIREACETLGFDMETGIESIRNAVAEMEDRQKMIAEREIVIGFLRLTDEAGKAIAKLEEIKSELLKKCFDEENLQDNLVPYKKLVDFVQSGDDLPDDLFDEFEVRLDKLIARQADKGCLVIDGNADLEKYHADAPEWVFEDNHGVNATPVNPKDAPVVPNPDPAPSEIDITPVNVVVTVETPKEEIHLDGYLADIKLDFTDVPGTEFNESECNKLMNENKFAAVAFAFVVNTGLYRIDAKDNATHKYNIRQACRLLHKQGYLGTAEVEISEVKIRYYFATSKGLEICSNSHFISRHKDLALPGVTDSANPGKLTKESALQMAVLSEYQKEQELVPICIIPPNDTFPLVIGAERRTKEDALSYVVACIGISGSEQAFIDALTKSVAENEEKFTILCLSENDIEVIKKQLPAELSDSGRVDFKLGKLPLGSDEKDGSSDWDSFGVEEPEKLKLTGDIPDFKVEYSGKETSKASVSSFKKECVYQLGKIWREVLAKTAMLKFADVDSIAARTDIPDKEIQRAAEYLYKQGYIGRILSGNRTIYLPSAKGLKIITSKEGAAFLGIKGSIGFSFVPETAAQALSLNAGTKTSEYVQRMKLDLDKALYGNNFFPSAFLLGYHDRTKECWVTFAGSFCVEAEEFSAFLDSVSTIPNAEFPKILCVVGYSKDNAKAVAEALKCRYPDTLAEVPFYCIDMTADTVYKYPKMNEVEWTSVLEPQDESDDEPEDTEEEPEPKQNNPKEPEIGDAESKEETVDIPHDMEESPDIPSQENDIENADVSDDGKDGESPEEEFEPIEIRITDAETTERLTPELEKRYGEALKEMLAGKKHYCASAYLRALAQKYPKYVPVSRQLAYALDDPMESCSFSSDNIFNVFFADNEAYSDFWTISAVLNNFFTDQVHYDYSLQSLNDAISKNPVLESIAPLKSLVNTLWQFKNEHHHGLDFYSDYRQELRKSFESRLAVIRGKAREQYENYIVSDKKENVSLKRFIETKKLIFARDGQLALCLDAVARDDREYQPLIAEYLEEKIVKSGSDISECNIDSDKIEMLIDEHWMRASQNLRLTKRNSDLTGSLRTNLLKSIRKVAGVLCDYIEVLNTTSVNESDGGLIAYKRKRAQILKDLGAASKDLQQMLNSGRDNAGNGTVLARTIETITEKIKGTYSAEADSYYYLDFLRTEEVLLDEDYMPCLYEIEELPELSAVERIEAHLHAAPQPLEARLNDILTGQDDCGQGALIIRYLNDHPGLIANSELLTVDIREAANHARGGSEQALKDFGEKLELKQSYGQIDNTHQDKKEIITQIVDHWKEIAGETMNYGFLRKILDAFIDKLTREAQPRAAVLNESLEAYYKGHPDWKAHEDVCKSVAVISKRIEVGNYTAAEDALNRLIAGDTEPEAPFSRNEFLEKFLIEYPENKMRVSPANKPMSSSFTDYRRTKESRAGDQLIAKWPKGNNASESTIKEVLDLLGFNVAKVTKQQAISGKDNYLVELSKPVNGRKSNYKHPVSVFGSEAETNGFRVVCLYGKYAPDDLIEVFKTIGNAKNTIVFLDYPLSLPERRELARKAKKNYNGKTFSVIDRVAVYFLAKNYNEMAISRMLMSITMPFAAYQPYVAESAQVMPPEIFMGRTEELEKIEQASGANIVYGGRQLGKSALLRMAQKDINNDENGDRAVLVEIKELNYKEAAVKVSQALCDEGILSEQCITEDWKDLSRNIKNRLRDGAAGPRIPYLLLLMDEADKFIESCSAVNYAPFDALKDIQSIGSGRFKFVVAGLRNVVRFNRRVALGNNSVLTHLSSLTITPFKAREARELLEVPLSYMGFRFPDDEQTNMLIATIFGTTNYFPGLLQLYCSKLIAAMKKDYAGYDEASTPPYEVREEHIKKVLSDITLNKQIREKYFITLEVGGDNYYYLIALLAAYHYHSNAQSGFAPEDIITLAADWNIMTIAGLSRESVKALMDEMKELNVLQETGNGNYRFARHSFCQMMGRLDQIEDEILKYGESEG